MEHDSSSTFLIDADNPGSPRKIGSGMPLCWIDARTLLTTRPYGTKLLTIDGKEDRMFFRDSTYAFPVLDGKYIVYRDVVVGRDPGVWIENAPAEGGADPGRRLLIKYLGNPVYKDSIVMPNPASSGTGYQAVYAWIQLMGEKTAWEFMDKLHNNIAVVGDANPVFSRGDIDF